MAPEQLEGSEADPRTDIFAFGLVLHEMITGKKTFEGKSRVMLMSAIATAEPQPLSSMQPAASPALEHVVKHLPGEGSLGTLADSARSARRAAVDRGRWGRHTGADGEAACTPRGSPCVDGARRGRRVTGALGGGAGSGLSSGGGRRCRDASAHPDSIDRRRPTADGSARVRWRHVRDLARQPHARVRGPCGAQDPLTIFVRPIASVTPQRLPGTDGASQPFWSADGRSIGFVSGGKLKKVEATGGPPQEIC